MSLSFILSGDSTIDLDYLSTTALDANSGTIRDTIGNDATLTLPVPGGTGSLSANKELVIDGIGLFTGEEQADLLANYAPAIQPDALGSHLNWAWQFVRDQAVFFPWYRRDAEHSRAEGMPPTKVLHDIVVEVLKAINIDSCYRGCRPHYMNEVMHALEFPDFKSHVNFVG